MIAHLSTAATLALLLGGIGVLWLAGANIVEAIGAVLVGAIGLVLLYLVVFQLWSAVL